MSSPFSSACVTRWSGVLVRFGIDFIPAPSRVSADSRLRWIPWNSKNSARRRRGKSNARTRPVSQAGTHFRIGSVIALRSRPLREFGNGAVLDKDRRHIRPFRIRSRAEPGQATPIRQDLVVLRWLDGCLQNARDYFSGADKFSNVILYQRSMPNIVQGGQIRLA